MAKQYRYSGGRPGVTLTDPETGQPLRDEDGKRVYVQQGHLVPDGLPASVYKGLGGDFPEVQHNTPSSSGDKKED